MSLRWPDKDPADVLDYGIDWAKALAADSIATVAWTVPAGLTRGAETRVGAITTIWLSGGTAETDHTLTCRITTAASRVLERDVGLLVRNL